MKQPYGSVLPPAPNQGDVCFIETGPPTAGTLYFCFGAGTWTAISGGVTGGASRLEYGAACILLANTTPWTLVAFPNVMHKFGADLMDNPAQYFSRCKWKLQEVGWAGVVNTWEDLDFANAADIYTFIRANFAPSPWAPNTAENHAILTWYDTIDDTLPHINKIWGVNSFYAMLKTSGAYRSTLYSLPDPTWPTFGAWFTDLCNQGVGFGPGHAYSPGEEHAIWLARGERKMYGLPRDGFVSTITTVGTRQIWDWGSSSFGALPGVVDYRNVPSSGAPLIFCSLNVNTHNSWTWCVGSGSNLIRNIMEDYSSTVALYALECATNPGYRALFLKPYGVDRLGLNWYDYNVYDLYALYTRKNTSPILRLINTAGMQESSSNDFMWLDRPRWEPPASSTRARLTKNMVGLQP